MRPVDRGSHPLAGADPKVFLEYADARGDLFDRLGRYCSFCERPIKAGLAVEHVLAKSRRPKLERSWDNFLLACVNCNSTKGQKFVSRKTFFLPDQDNTFRAFRYESGGRMAVNPTLTAGDRKKAIGTIELVGLDKIPLHDPQAKDLRWNDRREAWDKAERYLVRLGQPGIDEPTLVASIVDLCKADGHWSVWMTVFGSRTDVRRRLISEHHGTAVDCFDPDGSPVPRPGGTL
jgi:uncharacterized protein (TIGR02646 family)